jgi:hypothetical protein
MIIPAAAAVVLITAGGAKAQTTPGVASGPATMINPGTVFPNTTGSGFNNGSNNFGTPFNNGFATGFNSFDPRLQFDGSSLGFTPGVTPGNVFVPSTGYGYYNPYLNGYGYGYTPWYNNPANAGYMAMMSQQYGGGMRRGGGLPIAGLNSPPLRAGAPTRMTIRNGGSGSGYDVRAVERADELAQDNGPVQVGSTDPQQVSLANRMENVMLNQPLTQGTVVGKQDGGVLVRFQKDGEMETRRFENSQVFHFSNSGRLMTANTASMTEGTSVLVPLPASRVIRQSVAGSRQTYRATTKKAKKH